MSRVNPAEAAVVRFGVEGGAVHVAELDTVTGGFELGDEPEKRRWRTPRWLFDPLMEEFRFDLDACADATNALARRYIPRADDALLLPWKLARREREDVQGWGRQVRAAFMNPPWGRRGRGFPGTGAFVDRAWDQSREGLTVCVLIESATDTLWWQRAFRRADEVRIGPRVPFTRPDGTPGRQPPGGVTLFVFRAHVPARGWPQGPRARVWWEVEGWLPRRVRGGSGSVVAVHRG